MKENMKILSKLGLAALVAASPAAYSLASMNAYAYEAGENVGKSVDTGSAVIQLVASKYGYLKFEKSGGLNNIVPTPNDDTCGFSGKYVVTDTSTGKSTTYTDTSFLKSLKGNVKISGIFFKTVKTTEKRTIKSVHGTLTFDFSGYDDVVFDDNSKGYMPNNKGTCRMSVDADQGYKLSTVTVDGKAYSYETESNKIQPTPASDITAEFVRDKGKSTTEIESFNVAEGTSNGMFTVANVDNGYVYLPMEKHTILYTDEKNNTTKTTFYRMSAPKYNPDQGFVFDSYTITDAEGRTYSLDEYNYLLRYGNAPAVTVKVNFKKSNPVPYEDTTTSEFTLNGSGTQENITLAKSEGGAMVVRGTVINKTFKKGNAVYHTKTVKISAPEVGTTDKGYEYKYYTSVIDDKTKQNGFTDTYSVTYEDGEPVPELPKVTIQGVFAKKNIAEVTAVDTVSKGAKKTYGGVTVDNTKGHVSLNVGYTDEDGDVKFKYANLGTDADDGYTYGIRYLDPKGKEISPEEAKDLKEYTIEGYGVESEVKKTTLKSAIDTAKEVAKKADAETGKKLNDTINKAQNTYNDANAKQEAVNDAVKDLLKGMAGITLGDDVNDQDAAETLKKVADAYNSYANKYGSNEGLDKAIANAKAAKGDKPSAQDALKKLADADLTPYTGVATSIKLIGKGTQYTSGNITIDNTKGHADMTAEIRYGRLSSLTAVTNTLEKGYTYEGKYTVKDKDGKDATLADAATKKIVVTPVFKTADGKETVDIDDPNKNKGDTSDQVKDNTGDTSDQTGKSDTSDQTKGDTSDQTKKDGKSDTSDQTKTDGKTDGSKDGSDTSDQVKTDGKTDESKGDTSGQAKDGKGDTSDQVKTDEKGTKDDQNKGSNDASKGTDTSKGTDASNTSAQSGKDNSSKGTDQSGSDQSKNNASSNTADASKNATDASGKTNAAKTDSKDTADQLTAKASKDASKDTADQLTAAGTTDTSKKDDKSDKASKDTADQVDATEDKDNDKAEKTSKDDSSDGNDETDVVGNNDGDSTGDTSGDNTDDGISYTGDNGSTPAEDDGKGNTPDGPVKTGDATMFSSLIAGLSGAGAGIVAFMRRKKNR